MHYEEGKKQISKTVSVNDNDIETFNKLHEKGVELDVRGIPNERGFDLMTKL
ncbi:hypothetical protein GCM10025854_27150 [Tetragenococcus muriaticus]|nr:hypothetical protein GCM10025854_04110 [Tetragenococcus muriaticus]GMA48465.1 hypothetical protein GCM10025854_27150 [Tetragenococcus muriaticus]